MKLLIYVLIGLLSGRVPFYAQSPEAALPLPVSLSTCVQYALSRNPLVHQALLDQAIADRTIRSAKSAWLPQVSAAYNLQHYLKLPVTLVPSDFNNSDSPRRALAFGVRNTSTVRFQVDQTLFNRDVLLASRTATAYLAQAAQTTTQTRPASTSL